MSLNEPFKTFLNDLDTCSLAFVGLLYSLKKETQVRKYRSKPA